MNTETPKRLRLAGLWFMPNLFEENVMVLCMDSSGIGSPLAPKEKDTEETYLAKRKAASSLLRSVIAHPNVVLTTGCWGQDDEHPIHPLLQLFIAGLRGQGFGEVETVQPGEETHLCRNLPWCSGFASADLCHYCVRCFHAAPGPYQYEMARLYNPQNRFTGDCKKWMKAVDLAYPWMIDAIDRQNAKEAPRV